MRCRVCGRETPPWVGYCDRCREIIYGHNEHLKAREALRDAYDPTLDSFRCHYSHVPVDRSGQGNPFSLCLDHIVPVRSSSLVVSSELFNYMKNQLGPEEFPLAVRELAAHRAGRAFDRDLIRFQYWDLKAPRPSVPVRPLPAPRPGRVHVDACVVCGDPPMRWSYLCERCRALVWNANRNIRARTRALEEAWDPVDRCFRCHYTGARVDDVDQRGPWGLNFEHATPRDNGSIVVSCYWVNLMKRNLSESEFWAVVLEYDRFLREGGEFDRDVAEFRWWRRKKGRSTRLD